MNIMEKQRHSGYFEAILQLRNPSEELMSFIRNQLKKRGNVFIAKEEQQKNGIDLYVSNQRFTQSLGKRMKKSFKGELTISYRLFGRNRITSKDIYRVTVLFRM